MLTYRNNPVGVDPVSATLIPVPESDDSSARLKLLDTEGFFVAHELLSGAELERLSEALSREDHREDNHGAVRTRRGSVFARRDLLGMSAVQELIASPTVRNAVRDVLGDGARAVRGILLDKTPIANWLVPWHQDLSIAVRERREVAGFGPWSIKAGVHHVQPPLEILERMIAVRVHLDDCREDNGPLRVIARSHRRLWKPALLDQLVRESCAVTCCANAGDALFMRPTIVHTSSPARTPSRRRVLHIEYAARELPGGLEWNFAFVS